MDQQELHKLVRKRAHDLRTPITAIAGFADLLADDASLSEGGREMAATIVAETRRLAQTLESFFDEITKDPNAE